MPARVKTIQFLAVILTALALVPGGAHLFALPNKIAMDQDNYFVAQAIYRGWALFGIVLIGAVAANLLLAAAMRVQREAAALALTAALCILLTLGVFFIWTYPANVATDNWTAVPDNWRQLRTAWEYSHAASALIAFIALCATTLSVLAAGAGTKDRS
jgi:phosphoglycerol transferase MdoB-like AlkP superfamily enzyme